MWVVMPVKDIDAAKQRLAGVLDTAERRALFAAMLEDVLDAVAHAHSYDEVALVTRDPWAEDLAQTYRFQTIRDHENAGHTEAVNLAIAHLGSAGIAGMLTFPGDIPLVTPREIDTLLEAHVAAFGDQRGMTIAPSRDKHGSNAIACTPPDAVPFRFGSDSFFPHLEAARRTNIEPRVVELAGFGLDIDTPDDLIQLATTEGTTRTHEFLKQSGIEARLATQAADVVA